MRTVFTLMLLAVMASSLTAQRTPFSKDDMIRAAYLASNPAQATKDPATGEVRGLVQLRRGVFDGLIGPQGVDHLLAV